MRAAAVELAAPQEFFEKNSALLRIHHSCPLGKGQLWARAGSKGYACNGKKIRLQADPNSYTPFLPSLERKDQIILPLIFL